MRLSRDIENIIARYNKDIFLQYREFLEYGLLMKDLKINIENDNEFLNTHYPQNSSNIYEKKRIISKIEKNQKKLSKLLSNNGNFDFDFDFNVHKFPEKFMKYKKIFSVKLYSLFYYKVYELTINNRKLMNLINKINNKLIFSF